MRPLSDPAHRQVVALIDHYERLGRSEATRNLIAALQTVSDRIEASGGRGLPAPNPYPQIARLGLSFSWLKQSPYWFAFTGPPDMIITAVFYETADIPNRLG